MFKFTIAKALRAMSVEILSTGAQIYEKSHLKRLAMGEHLKNEVIRISAI